MLSNERKVLKFIAFLTFGKVKDCVFDEIINMTEYNYKPFTMVGVGSMVYFVFVLVLTLRNSQSSQLKLFIVFSIL